MKRSEVLRYRKIGMETLLTSIKFFYSHISLLCVSLIPSVIRAIQMLNPAAPFWLEGIVFITRCFLFVLIIIMMTKSKINDLRDKNFWDKLGHSASIQFQKNWPYGFLAQIIVFLVLLYGVGNLFIMLLSWLFSSNAGLIGIQSTDSNALYNACIYFLKNMSVIPLTLVYIVYISGLRPVKN